ncbi:MAG: hypothetical protein M0P49_02490 [Bacilli bacterium]|nr:hypothetical protein [Bacilli bacterium]
MEELKYTQSELLNLINQYSQTPRKIIKQNLKRILTEHNIKPRHIIQLGYMPPNVYAWLAPTTNNIPMLDQALTISVAFDFSIEEFLIN